MDRVNCTIQCVAMEEEMIISLAPKLGDSDERCDLLKKRLKEREVEIKRNSFLEPFDSRPFRELNAMPPLGLSSAARTGKG